MIVWGGIDGAIYNTGARYDPSTDSWTATIITNAPAARWLHTAVWTGSEMVVWGGRDSNFLYPNTGGRYNPTTIVGQRPTRTTRRLAEKVPPPCGPVAK